MVFLISENLAPIMFLSLIFFLLLGYPAAFSLAANGLLFFLIGVELAPFSGGAINLSWPLLTALPDRFWSIMSNETLLAIPFFTFMGLILERSGMAEDLLNTIGELFGSVRGGLTYAVILVGGLLAATTGVVAASVIAMGLISLPIMLRYGYDRSISSGAIVASGTLAQIIPPSLVLIVLADQLGRPVGDMYRGAIVPGMILVGLYLLYIYFCTVLKKEKLPAIPQEARQFQGGRRSLTVLAILAISTTMLSKYSWLAATDNSIIYSVLFGFGICFALVTFDKFSKTGIFSELTHSVVFVLLPPLGLVFLVLGTIFLGIATPTEGGAMGAVGALAIAVAKRRLTRENLVSALQRTTRLSSFVLFILIGARVFSLTFYGVNGHIWVEHLLLSIPGGETGFLIIISILVFLLAFFLDFFELAFIVVPLLAPVAILYGIDLIWFGVLLGINMQTSFMHPPFGFALFYLRSVAAKKKYIDPITKKMIAPVTTGQIYRGAIPFLAIQLLVLGLTIAFPQLVLHYKTPKVQVKNTDIIIPSFSNGSKTNRSDSGFVVPSFGN